MKVLYEDDFKVPVKKTGTFLGKKHSLETRNKMKVSASTRDKSTYYKIPSTPEIIRKRERSRKESWDKLSVEEKHKRLLKFIQAGRHCRNFGTSIEKRVNEILSDFGMTENQNYQRNVSIGIYNVDFLIDNKYIVECYGDYWHQNPKYFNDPIAGKKRQADLRKRQYLESQGFKFVYFWENEIVHDGVEHEVA